MRIIELYDNGHGSNTPGKCSPDGRLKEYLKTRELVRDIVKARKAMGYDARILVPEDMDISLSERVMRVNAICKEHGASNVLLVSIHCNAAGSGAEWKTAGGWSAYTSPGNTKADQLATDLYEAAEVALRDYIKDFHKHNYDNKQRPIRTDMSDKDPDYEANFYILTKTMCPAVLTESMFQDNRADVDFLLSPNGHNAIVELHVKGVDAYVKRISKA